MFVAYFIVNRKGNEKNDEDEGGGGSLIDHLAAAVIQRHGRLRRRRGWRIARGYRKVRRGIAEDGPREENEWCEEGQGCMAHEVKYEEVMKIVGVSHDSAKTPSIHLLLSIFFSFSSFPNSGTSFTSLLIRLASNTTSGTNYGMETNPGASAMSVPIYDWSEFGPYWIHPPGGNAYSSRDIDDDGRRGDKFRNYDVPPPHSSIVTKTHCGSRCVFCPPQEYLETGAYLRRAKEMMHLTPLSRMLLILCTTSFRIVI